MAQTKRKRKHRGNAAGMVESRGRTGRKLTDEERNPGKDGAGKPKKGNALDREPTWRNSANRAVIAALVFTALVLFIFKQKPAQAISLGAFMFLIYIPMGFYTDRFLYRRRLVKKAAGGGADGPKAKPKTKDG
jgi:hypothetical protein